MLIWFPCCTGLCSSSTSTAESCSNWQPVTMWWGWNSLFVLLSVWAFTLFLFYTETLFWFPSFSSLFHFHFISHDWVTLDILYQYLLRALYWLEYKMIPIFATLDLRLYKDIVRMIEQNKATVPYILSCQALESGYFGSSVTYCVLIFYNYNIFWECCSPGRGLCFLEFFVVILMKSVLIIFTTVEYKVLRVYLLHFVGRIKVAGHVR